MPTTSVEGIDIYYEDTGGEGPVLVFNHGLLLDIEMYRPQIDALRDRYRCIAWDQRGFGRTGEVARPFTYWDSAKDALAVLDAAGVEEAAFIGLSQGGFLTMRAALLAPARVRAMVLISTCHGTDTPEVREGLEGMVGEWKANGHVNLKEGLAGLLLGPEPDPTPWFAKWSAMSKTVLDHPGRTLIDRDDLSARMGELKAPAIVIHGEADQAIDIALGEAMAAVLPNCTGFVRVPGACHAPTLSHPAIVNQAIAGFLEVWT
jgi:pimeloyl-ACP methyl ester carboxylesterase